MGERFDAVVIGAGPGGCSSALRLAQAGWRVALVERKPFPRTKVCGEYLSATNRPLLARLGVCEAFDSLAGPEVTRVGLYAGKHSLTADLPLPRGCKWGRALSRGVLDTFLRDRAASAGTQVFQPCTVKALRREGEDWVTTINGEQELRSPIVIAAHGSWEPGNLPTQHAKPEPRPGDLFGFKAHFHNADLPTGLMPLLSFPGGYGGMVHAEGGRVSLSCCVRRDVLDRLRRHNTGTAGEVVQAYLCESMRGVERVLRSAYTDGPWLGAGPIRPGERLRWPTGIFGVGNAAGEAHPVVAEGVSMALQAGWLISERLVTWRRESGRADDLPRLAADYATAWRRAFRPRRQAAAWIAQWAMRPGLVALSVPFIRAWPSILSLGARASGKTTCLVELAS